MAYWHFHSYLQTLPSPTRDTVVALWEKIQASTTKPELLVLPKLLASPDHVRLIWTNRKKALAVDVYPGKWGWAYDSKPGKAQKAESICINKALSKNFLEVLQEVGYSAK